MSTKKALLGLGLLAAAAGGVAYALKKRTDAKKDPEKKDTCDCGCGADQAEKEEKKEEEEK